MMSVLGIGNALTDMSFSLNDNSLLKELGLCAGSMNHIDALENKRIIQGLEGYTPETVPGGSAANTVVSLAKLGLKSGFIGMVGDDSIGRVYGEDMEKNGVHAHLLRGKGPSGTSLVFINSQDGERTFATSLGAALELVPDDILPAFFEGYDCLHAEGYLAQCPHVLEKAMQYAKSRGMVVSFDLGSYSIVEKNLPMFVSIVEKYADIVFANDSEASAFTGKGPQEAAAAIASMGEGKIAAVKLGSRGSLLQCGKEICRIKAKEVPAVDTTGAGDAYAAGFLYAYSQGADLHECGLCGTILASEVVGILGPKIGKSGWEVAKRGILAVLEKKG